MIVGEKVDLEEVEVLWISAPADSGILAQIRLI